MKLRYFLNCGAAAAAVLAATAPAWAAETDGDIVVTATGVPQDRADAGQAITLITRDEIEARQTVSLSDLLATVPGVGATRSGGPGGLTAVRIRGAEDRHTLVLIDGVRINDPSSTGGAFDFGNLLSLTVDHVEVLRGANSVPWGSQAIGGIVNISTMPATQDIHARAYAEYGYKNAVNTAVNVSGGAGAVTTSFTGGYFTDDGVSAYRNGTERDGYRQVALAGQVGVALSETAGLDFRAYFADSRRDIDGFPAPLFVFADTPDYAKTREFVVYAGAHASLFDGAFRNRIDFTQTAVDRDNFQPTSSFGPITSFARGIVQRVEYRGDADLTKGVRAIFGAEHEFSRINNGARSSTQSTSGYGELVLTPISRVTVTGGVRIDDYRTYGTKTIFAANLAWRATDTTTVRAAYSEGFKAPSLYQLYSFYGTPGLQPETAKSYEVGVEQKFWQGRVSLGATAFQRDSVNLIDFFNCFGSGNPQCRVQPNGFYYNVGRARSRGVEVTATVRPTDQVTIEANYTYSDSKDRATDLRLLRRPSDLFNLIADWKTPIGITLGTTVQVVGESDDIDFQTFSRTRLKGYTLVALRASVPVGERLELYGRVENVGDERYEAVSGYGTVGRAGFIGARVKL